MAFTCGERAGIRTRHDSAGTRRAHASEHGSALAAVARLLPRLVGAAAALTAHDDPDFHYRLGIDVFIAGVQAIAQR